MTTKQLENLIDYLDRRLDREGCDNTHRFTIAWAEERGIDQDDVLDFVRPRGGCCCDCEVVLNVPFFGGAEVLRESDTPAPPPKPKPEPRQLTFESLIAWESAKRSTGGGRRR